MNSQLSLDDHAAVTEGVARFRNEPASDAVILVVDDDAANRRLIGTLLRRTTPARVIDAGDPRTAMRLACTSERPIDLLISDIELGAVTDGIQLAHQVAAVTPAAKVLLISGNPDRARELPPQWRFLEKPFRMGALLDFVRYSLGWVADSCGAGRPLPYKA